MRSENQELPLGAIRSREQERVVQINARLKRPEDFREIIVARKGGAPACRVKLWQVADVVDGPQEVESLALYNGQRTVLLSVQKSQGENTIAGRRRPDARRSPRRKPLMPPGIKTEVNRDNSRSIRVSVANVQRTLIEGAALTVLIVFLFLNSWRSTVITGLTLPIALIGTFLFMYVFGFTINMHHADGAVAVRGPADRRRDRGAREHRAPRADGQERRTRRRSTAPTRSAWRCWRPRCRSSRCSCRSASWAASSASSSTSSASRSSPRC